MSPAISHQLLYIVAGVIPAVFLVLWLLGAAAMRAGKSGNAASAERAFLWNENKIAFVVVLVLVAAAHGYLGHNNALWSEIDGHVVTSEERITRRGGTTTWITVIAGDDVREISSEGLSASDCRQGDRFTKAAWSYNFTCRHTTVEPDFWLALLAVPFFGVAILWRLGGGTRPM